MYYSFLVLLLLNVEIHTIRTSSSYKFKTHSQRLNKYDIFYLMKNDARVELYFLFCFVASLPALDENKILEKLTFLSIPLPKMSRLDVCVCVIYSLLVFEYSVFFFNEYNSLVIISNF